MSAPQTFRVSIVAVMLFQIAALFAKSRLELELVDTGFSASVAKHLSYLVVPPILLILMYPYIARCKSALRSLLQLKDLTAQRVLRAGLVGLTLRLLRWAFLTVLIWLGVTQDSEGGMFPMHLGFACPPLPVLLLSVLVMTVLVPFVEEVVNRGFIMHALLPRGRALAVILSAALFAALHPPGSYALTFAAGLVFAVQALNFRTLWAPLSAHLAYNAAAIVDWECLKIVWNPSPGDPLLARLALLSAAALIVGSWLVWRLTRERAAGGSVPVSSPAVPTTGRSPAAR